MFPFNTRLFTIIINFFKINKHKSACIFLCVCVLKSYKSKLLFNFENELVT